MLLITSADHFIGHSIASHLARHEALRPSLRLICENKTPCLNFAAKGMDVRQVDYTHPNDLSLAFRGVDHMILAIGNEEHRVSICEKLCRVASRSGVKSIICISHVGAVSTEHTFLQQYAAIEDQVINANCEWTILRPDWIHQNFHHWATFIEKYRRMALPLPQDAELCPIDIIDLCQVVENIVLSSTAPKHIVAALPDQHAGQVYTLTGTDPVTGKEMVQHLIAATGFTKFAYQNIRPMDTDYYLFQLPMDIWFDARIKREQRQIYNDTLDGFDYSTRAFAAPTATQKDTWLDYFDWVRSTASSVSVPHAPVLLSRPVRPIHEFFQENANSFKPRV
ncbi:hypothetical protein BX666DRAFT_1925132 [Dichotomocladium elegans]|nr:hypothetical protein BX666DRAFT_1925132 [Dichotomocladium elegans]